MSETSQVTLQSTPVTIVTGDPTISVLAEMKLDHNGVMEMAQWVRRYRPNCVPEAGFNEIYDLLPHNGKEPQRGSDGFPLTKELPGNETETVMRQVSDNEILAELAGRKCYDSFADAGAERPNSAYLASMWEGRIPHRSTGYHPKMTFFIADVSRRVSHELIRNYVGSDRDEEGSPSQESTRFTHHYGTYIAPPRDLESPEKLERFRRVVQRSYDEYCAYIREEAREFKSMRGTDPKGMDRKRIYEAASHYLHHSCATSWIWTTNPMALAKLFAERCDAAADLEFQRFANKWKKICLDRWPSLFPHVQR